MRSKKGSRTKRRSRNEIDLPKVSLTSLMDIVTNILVYTIKIFAVSAIAIQDPSVSLPKSSSRQDAENAVVVMITGTLRKEAEDDVTEYIHETPSILVDDRVILKLDPKTYRVPANAKERGYVITVLKKELIKVRKEQIETADLTKGEGFSGRVVIVADKETPYKVLADVLVTCSEAGFGSFQFAIVKREA